jgi:hypothetical protein
MQCSQAMYIRQVSARNANDVGNLYGCVRLNFFLSHDSIAQHTTAYVTLLIHSHIILRITHNMHLSRHVHATQLPHHINKTNVAPSIAHCTTTITVRMCRRTTSTMPRSIMRAFPRVQYGSPTLYEGREQCAQRRHAKHRSQRRKAACNERNVDFDDGPEEAVRCYANDVVRGHAHDVLLLDGVCVDWLGEASM